MSSSTLHPHTLCPSFLVAIAIFSVFTLSGIVSAAWVDAPNAPPNYGITGCTYPCLQADFQPMNLSAAPQIKKGSISATGFFDTDNPLYFIDPADLSLGAGRFNSSVAIVNGTLSAGRAQPLPLNTSAKIVANNPETLNKTGTPGDALYAYASTTNAAISAEQGNPAGYGIYSSGGINYFQGNVGIGTASPASKVYVAGGSFTANAGQSNNPVYALGAQSIGADASIYSYGPICSGNSQGNCLGSGGTVMDAGGIKFPNGSVQTTAAARGIPLYIPNISCAERGGTVLTDPYCTGYTVIGYCGPLCTSPYCWPGGKDGWRYVTGTCSNTFIGYAVTP